MVFMSNVFVAFRLGDNVVNVGGVFKCFLTYISYHEDVPYFYLYIPLGW